MCRRMVSVAMLLLVTTGCAGTRRMVVSTCLPKVEGLWLTEELAAFLGTAEAVEVSYSGPLHGPGTRYIPIDEILRRRLARKDRDTLLNWLSRPGSVIWTTGPETNDPVFGVTLTRGREALSMVFYPEAQVCSYSFDCGSSWTFVTGTFQDYPSDACTLFERLGAWARRTRIHRTNTRLPR